MEKTLNNFNSVKVVLEQKVMKLYFPQDLGKTQQLRSDSGDKLGIMSLNYKLCLGKTGLETKQSKLIRVKRLAEDCQTLLSLNQGFGNA